MRHRLLCSFGLWVMVTEVLGKTTGRLCVWHPLLYLIGFVSGTRKRDIKQKVTTETFRLKY